MATVARGRSESAIPLLRRLRCTHNAESAAPIWKEIMNLHLALTPIVSLIAGVLILIVPRLLNFIVAIYLILIGLIGLFPALTS